MPHGVDQLRGESTALYRPVMVTMLEVTMTSKCLRVEREPPGDEPLHYLVAELVIWPPEHAPHVDAGHDPGKQAAAIHNRQSLHPTVIHLLGSFGDAMPGGAARRRWQHHDWCRDAADPGPGFDGDPLPGTR